MELRIPREIVDSIAAQARREAPNECCGYLGATPVAEDRWEILRAFPMTNADRSPTHYTLDPQEQFSVLSHAREEGLSLVAVYHSHPETPARMSEEDLRLAYDDSTVYVIYSIPEDEINGYRVKDHRVVGRVAIRIYQDTRDLSGGVARG